MPKKWHHYAKQIRIKLNKLSNVSSYLAVLALFLKRKITNLQFVAKSRKIERNKAGICGYAPPPMAPDKQDPSVAHIPGNIKACALIAL